MIDYATYLPEFMLTSMNELKENRSECIIPMVNRLVYVNISNVNTSPFQTNSFLNIE